MPGISAAKDDRTAPLGVYEAQEAVQFGLTGACSLAAVLDIPAFESDRLAAT